MQKYAIELNENVTKVLEKKCMHVALMEFIYFIYNFEFLNTFLVMVS